MKHALSHASLAQSHCQLANHPKMMQSLKHQRSTNLPGSCTRKKLENREQLCWEWALLHMPCQKILVIHEETLLAAVMAGTIMWLSKKAGPGIAQALDARSDEILENMNKGRVAQISALEAEIQHEKNTEAALETRAELFEVVKDNNEMRLDL